MYVIRLDCEIQNFTTKLDSFVSNQRLQANSYRPGQDFAPVLRYPDKVIIDVVGRMSSSFAVHERMIAHAFCVCNLTETGGRAS